MALTLHLFAPLAPLALEFGLTGEISTRSVTLAASMYAIAIGTSSKWLYLFILALLGAAFYMFCFGFALGGSREFWQSATLAGSGIALILIAHAIERYVRHVKNKTPFFSWRYNPEGAE